MNSSNSSSGGIGFCGLLTVLFIALKLTGFIGWSWLWVLAPIWIPLVLLFVLAIGPRPALYRRDRALGPLCDGVHLHELRRHSAGHGRTRSLRPVDRGLPRQAPHPQARDVAVHEQGECARREKRRRPQPCLQGLPRHPQTGRLEAVQKEIYEPIAETQHCKWKAIQGVVRRAAKLAWEVNPDAVRVMAVYPLTGCPSTGGLREPRI